jgi:hypothetical protein
MTDPWVGLFVGNQSGPSDYQTLFEQAYLDLGHLSYVRCFDSTIKSDPTTARFNLFKGVRVHYSLKPINGDYVGFATGKQSAAYKKLVSALPSGSRLSVWHEPEDDMSSEQFYQLTKIAVSDLKAVRPDVEFTYTAMAYQWATNSKGNVSDPTGWLSAAKLCDSVAIDVYAPEWNYVPLAQHTGFFNWMTKIATPSGKLWGIAEHGVDDHLGEDARMKILATDFRAILQSRCAFYQYWNADWTDKSGTTYGYALKGPNEKALHRMLAAQGRCR